MSPSIDLVRVGASCPDEHWPNGTRTEVPPTSAAIGQALLDSAERGVDAVLVLDGALALRPSSLFDRLLSGSGDVWHGGLLLGNGGRPRELDYVAPTWMLTLDPDASIEATSWRLSLRCCFLRTSVVRHLGAPSDRFETLAGAALDLGLHAIRSGVVVRHVPGLATIDAGLPVSDGPPTAGDGLRLVARHHGRRWLWWAGWRRFRHTHRLIDTIRKVAQLDEETGRLIHPEPFPPSGHGATGRGSTGARPAIDPRVSVLVPTIDRYPYLRTLLEQLARQTVPPAEVLVVDQTPPNRRVDDIATWMPGLPVRVQTLETAGQCTSRNAGIAAATGDLLLFLDDDDEIEPSLLERHLRILASADVTASSGGVDEVGAPPPPYGFTYPRVSDVFPTNNTLLRFDELARSGLFDIAFDRGARADHDLGTRLYLGGALLLFDPRVRLLHHHAPRGGLRSHGARTVTRASSRNSFIERQLPEVTQLYLWHRYYRPDQVTEAILISMASLMGHDGSLWRRVLRAGVQLLLLPDSVHQVHARDRRAQDMLRDRETIRQLPASRPPPS